MSYYLLYNPKAGNGKCEAAANELAERLKKKNELSGHADITQITDYGKFLSDIPENSKIVIVGGDGTLNRFANDMGDLLEKYSIYYYPAGTGNDFLRDIAESNGDEPFCIDKYLKDLPTVTINGESRKFINGIGYGIDGYCCEVGDKIRETAPNTDINYAGIAIKGLLFHYKPTDAVITVDGKKYEYKKVWLAPTMHGRYYGGGMMATPDQNREDTENISTMVMFGSGKLKTLMVFPSLFKGKHVEHTDVVRVHKGHNITVEFNRPTALQIDGETVLGVTSYSVSCAK